MRNILDIRQIAEETEKEVCVEVEARISVLSENEVILDIQQPRMKRRTKKTT